MKKLLKISSAICGAILTVLGFSACAPVDKYGMPPSKYISGKVSDKVSGKAIEGIQVTNWSGGDKYGVPAVSYTEQFAFTDENGNYTLRTYEILPNLTFSDIDGMENGLYNDTTVTVDDNYINVSLTPKN